MAGRDDYADDFLQALELELAQFKQPQDVDTIFIGGGTPTHLDAQWLEKLLKLVTFWFPLAENGEFSVEANPSDIREDKLQVLKRFGINRISLGVQSFTSSKLARLERDHDYLIAENAVENAAREIGNVSVDLIFAAPGETLEQWQHDLDTALALPIQHLSTYGLTFEKGTQFWNRRNQGQLQAADEELELAMYKAPIAKCVEAGWRHYEVSNFAKPGFECRHNLAYWEGRGWYAAGPGAAAFANGCRTVNHRSPTTYIRRLIAGQSPVAESEKLDRESWARERLVFGLRMLAGVDLMTIEAETGCKIGEFCKPALMKLEEAGMIERQGSSVRLTEQGLFVSDAVSGELL